jgi:hypothetical protein
VLSAGSYILKDMAKRTLYLNNVIVGEIEQTGDVQKDIETGRAFLKSKGLWKQITVPQAMFRHAKSFANTASDLQRALLQTPANCLIIAPFVVNSALSIELYLKTMLTLSGSKVVHIHSLLDLYDKLPSDTKAAMLSAAKQAAKKYEVHVTQLSDLRNFIAALDKGFVEWRYAYEKGSTPVFHIWEAILVMHAAHETCRALLDSNMPDTPCAQATPVAPAATL